MQICAPQICFGCDASFLKQKYFESRDTVRVSRIRWLKFLRIPIRIRNKPNFAYPYFSQHWA